MSGSVIPDIILSGVKVVNAAGVLVADVGIKNGKISAFFQPGLRRDAGETIEGNGLYLLPGLIETHLHTRVPAFNAREDFFTGTAAAAAGGITTVFEMPVSKPPTYSVHVLEERVGHAKRDALVDFAFYGAAGEDNIERIVPLASAGVIGFKTFTQGPPMGREKEFIGLCAKTSASLYRVFREIASTGLISAIHAEEDSLISLFRNESSGAGLEAYARTRPPLVELEAVARSLVLSRAAGVRLAVCHVSTAEAVQLIENARSSGQEAYMETCPHYLLCSYEDSVGLGPFAKMKPPLRSRETVARLMKMYVEGRIDYIGSDHAPFTEEEKMAHGEDLSMAPDGIAAMELTLPLLLAQVRAGRLRIEDVVRTCSEQPAKIFGLYPRKGVIALGSDADLILIDLDQTSSVHIDQLKTRAKACAKLYENRELGGKIVLTMVRGRPVMKNGDIVGSPGWGNWIRCSKIS
jgi:allantoinase